MHYPYSFPECEAAAAERAMDRIQGMRVFVRVVDLGSFSKAATELGIGQPSATKLVAHLEAILGSRLLHRSTRGVTPTEIGLLFYEKCKLITQHVDEAESVATLLQSQIRGVLRVGCSVAFGRRVLVPLVIGFMESNPNLQVDLSFEDRYVNLVEQGIDVAIRMGRLADSSLGSSFLGINPWVVVAAPTYLSEHGVPRSPASLKQHRALVYSTVQGDARWLFTSRTGSVRSIDVRGPLRSNNLSALLAAARGGMGVAALPRYVAQLSIESGALRPILEEWSLPSQEVHAVYPSPRLVPAKVNSFVACLKEALRDRWWTR